MKKLLVIGLIACVAGCTQTPSIETGPDAEYTYDGLVRIKNSRLKDAWVDPDVDLTQYNKIMVGDAVFEFRSAKKSTSASMIRRANESEYWMSDTTKQKLIDTVTEVFRDELQKSQKFTLADQAGPDVLVLVGGLHDIVSLVPPEQVGRSEIYLRSVGEATLVIEARDSLSGETIYRAVDRRAAERAGGDLVNSNAVTNMAEVRRLARRWATRLREGLDSIHE
jgi:hypothetical protein